MLFDPAIDKSNFLVNLGVGCKLLFGRPQEHGNIHRYMNTLHFLYTRLGYVGGILSRGHLLRNVWTFQLDKHCKIGKLCQLRIQPYKRSGHYGNSMYHHLKYKKKWHWFLIANETYDPWFPYMYILRSSVRGVSSCAILKEFVWTTRILKVLI